MNYRPLPPFLKIKDSPIEGVGLFTTMSLKKGEVLGITHVIDTSGNFLHDLIRTPLGGFINHSKTPNCTKRKKGDVYRLETKRDIEKGEELTLNYTLYTCGVQTIEYIPKTNESDI